MKYFEKVMFRISLLNLDTVDQTEILHENVLFSGKMKARYRLGSFGVDIGVSLPL